MIPDSFIQDLLARTDIVDVIEAQVPLKKSGTNFVACCPFHNEKTPSFSVSQTKQFYHCFGCGEHGTAIGFLMAYQGLGFVDAIKSLASRLGMVIPDTPNMPNRRVSEEEVGQIRQLQDIMEKAAGFYRDCLKKTSRASDYCKARGLTGEVAARFGMGYAPPAWDSLKAVFPNYPDALKTAGLVIENEEKGRRYDRFRDRLMIPIVNEKGETIGFGGRIIDVGEPKYLNSPETPLFEKGREVFGLPQARIALREHNFAIVTEGYMDVIALSQHGVENALATLGTATTATHVQKIFRRVSRIIFCFDGDDAGRKAAFRALENSIDSLSDNKSVAFIFLPEKEDPDSFIRQFGKAAFLELCHQAEPLSAYLLRALRKPLDLGEAEGRAQLLNAIKPYLLRLNAAPSLRFQIIKEVATLAKMQGVEVENFCGIKSYAAKKPLRAPNKKPSLRRRLLKILLHQPQFLKSMDFSLIGERHDEYPAFLFLQSLSAVAQLSAHLICERSRGHVVENLLSDLMIEDMDHPMNDAAWEIEFNACIDKLKTEKAQTKRDQLLAQIRNHALKLSDLSGEEKELLNCSVPPLSGFSLS